jgi:AcrR family transcriptional regulator
MVERKQARGEATRAAIIHTATALFATRGYEATSIETVLEKSGISRGALYHHFDSKEALFEAVFETVEARIAQATVDASRGIADRVEAMRVGAEAFLDLSREPAIRQIVLTDAPAVLGWQKWRDIDARFGFGLLKSSLQAAARDGRLRPDLVEVYAHILLAALLETALVIARARDPAKASRLGRAALKELVDRLLGPKRRGANTERRWRKKAPTS